jgi:hypothetical protein
MTQYARYGIGLVAMPGELHAALGDVLAQPRPQHQVKVIACREPLTQALRQWQGKGKDPDVCEWLVSLPAEGVCPWRFERIHPRQLSGALASPLPGFAQSVPDRHKDALDHHLRSGGGLLTLQSVSDLEERVAWTMLLRHASGGVQTHDMRSQYSP